MEEDKIGEPELTTCTSCCYCYLCETKIGKGEKYLVLYKKAMKGVARINLCSRCLKLMSKQIRYEDVKAIENRLILKELEK